MSQFQQKQPQDKQPQDNQVLARENCAIRDSLIEFTEYGHKYTILTDKTSKYTSVTTWCHSHFPKFNADEVVQNMMMGKNWNSQNKYWNMTPQQIKAGWTQSGALAAKQGTSMHYDIECFMNQQVALQTPPQPTLTKTIGKMKTRSATKRDTLTSPSPQPSTDQDEPNTPSALSSSLSHNLLLLNYFQKEGQEKEETAACQSKEWSYFLDFVKDHPLLKPYRTEWMIYDEELKLAGSIDMVYENVDGTLSIYDWKRTKEITKTSGFNKCALTDCVNYIPDTNFWHYSLQLNTYKSILERNYGKIVSNLCLVRLHPEANGYELLQVPIMTNEIHELFQLRKSMCESSESIHI